MVPILDVYDSATGNAVLVGRARFTLRRAAISTTFTYDETFLGRPDAYEIDPALPLHGRAAHCAGIPGIFRDSAPDRWGRHLILRESEARGLADDRAPHQLDEVDFLIGVFDRTREGSLRFREPDSTFLATGDPIPPVLQLPKLLAASRAVADDQAGRSQIKELLDAGSGSLGGARPKASVCEDGKLLLAKFSHPHDEWDVMAWEKTMLDMAHDIGIPVPASKLVRIGDESVLLLERFDRDRSLMDGTRIPYMSAMTALQANDGERRDYAELMEEMAYLVRDPKAALAELFVRVVFSVAVNNTDDHLRNWGFLREHNAWHLAPLFDVNPNPSGNAQRATTILGEGGEGQIRTLQELAAYAGLDDDQARDLIENVLVVVKRWNRYAAKNGCSERERKLFAPIFEQRQADLAAL